jgi:hypothetical protein
MTNGWKHPKPPAPEPEPQPAPPKSSETPKSSKAAPKKGQH